jgi:crotonobetainyl-CoA:carnitine CoA-transferase CaiB-like acyl-CoA transferase
MPGPLTGIHVLDLTQGVAGPYATKLCADYGADVLKIEHPLRGDVSRRLGPFPGDDPHPERSGRFLELNTGKQSVTLNLATLTGRGILRRLAAEADLIVESFRPGTLERFGLGPEVLREASPRAALVRISNFGQTGPYRDFNADDMLMYAMGGVLAVTAVEGRDPVKIGLYAPLFLAGAIASAFTLGALSSARRTQRGEAIDFSIHEALAASMDRGGPNLVAYQYSGAFYFTAQQQTRTTAVPAGVYPCQDGYIMVTAGPNWWDRFCRTIDRPDLIDNPDFVARLYDINFAPEIDAIFYPWLFAHTKQQAMELGQAQGLPVAAINRADDVLNDPHLRARHFWTELPHPLGGTQTLPGLPVRMHGTPGELRRAPMLGEHTAAVLATLGYTAEDLPRLRANGVI